LGDFKKGLLALALILGVQGAALAVPDTWKVYFDPKGRFTMRLPQTSIALDIKDAGIGARIFTPDGPTDSAGILVMAIPADATCSLEEYFSEVKLALTKSFDSKLYSEYKIVSDQDTVIGEHPAKTLTTYFRYKLKDPHKYNPEHIQVHHSFIDGNNLFTVVCTVEREQFPRYEQIFKDAVNSIAYIHKPAVIPVSDGPG
jgi:hypothetical protein